MITNKKPLRTIGQQVTNQGFNKPSLYSISGLINFGSESNANFVDVISVGPISSIDNVYINDTDISTGEFPLSEVYTHTGETETQPFEGNFPYAERAYGISKQADTSEGPDNSSTTTVFKRSVSGVGVSGIRLSFTAPQFTHRDNKNRRKKAEANFRVHLLDENGSRVKTERIDNPYFYSTNPVSVQLTLLARDQDLSRVWEYEVEMSILTNQYGTVAAGNWSASIVTELYKDTQTYKDIAMASGKIVSSDVSGSTPRREYLVNGYKVDVPVYYGENDLFLGEFTKATSNSHAWNAMAVLVDDKWGAGLPLDKINISSFVAFDKYLSEVLSDGTQRYKHSQELLKADNYFRIASQIVGAADGKLYEDTSGRIGVLIDKQTDNRRVITSYDIQDEKVKRTTVPDKKKTNYVEIEYSDETNNFQKNIISVQDDLAITKNGLISQKLKSDTCTVPQEARRTIEKVLATSQIATSTYVFSVGHTHEDVQIGEVVALYDRIYSRVNYCGKVAAGTTSTEIIVDKRTPINLEGISNPYLVLDNDRGVPAKYPINSWTNQSVTLSAPLQTVPEDFTSFAVESNDIGGLKPTLMRVMGVTDNKGVLQLECLEYNDSLQSYIENGTDLVIPIDRIIPDPFEELTGLTVSRVGDSLVGNWDAAATDNYVYAWRKYTDNTASSNGSIVSSGTTSAETVTLPAPLDPAKYSLFVYILDETTGESSTVKRADILLGVSENNLSTIDPPTNLQVQNSGGQYTGKSFTLSWDQTISGTADEVSGYLLRITQDGLTLEYQLSGEDREKDVPTVDLVDKFGENFDRDFIISLIAFDQNLDSVDPVVRTIDNPAPVTPVLEVQVTGDIKLETQLGTPLEDDVVESVIYIWKSIDPNSPRPLDATEIRTTELSEVNIPDDFIDYDGSTYVYEAAWIDTFGEQGINFARQSYTFDPDLLVPVPPVLERVVPINSTTVKIDFTHDGTWLRKIKAFYRRYGSEDTWIQVANIYTFPVPAGETDRGFDAITGEGFILVSGLSFNTEFEYYVQAANEDSAYSVASDVINGAPATFIDTEDLESFLGSLDPRALIIEGTTDVFEDDVLNKSVVKETVQRRTDTSNLVADLSRIRSDFNTSASQATAAITDLSTVFTSSSQAIAKQVELLEAGFNDNSAAISSISQALVDETQARVVSIQDLTAKLVTETSTRVAQITQVSQALANEETIRAQQVTQLTAVDEANADQIATVADNAIAAIGYCTIGGNPATQGDKSSCEAAGGTWTEAPLAEAVRQTQVTSGSDSATVGSHYQSFVGLNNELVGKATIGVNTGGVFTGLNIVGGNNLSSITFQGDTFKIEDTSGEDALYWNSSDNEWKFSGGGSFSGELKAASGSFEGTVQADKIIGDVEANTVAVGTLIKSPTVQFLGTQYMKIQSAIPFGPNGLIEWYGVLSGNVDGNNDPIYSNLTKTNAITYLGDDGSAYFGGTIIAGTLTTSVQNPSVSNTPELSTGTFGSNGGQIAVLCSINIFANTGEVSGSCPTTPPPAPEVTLTLYEIVNGSEVFVKSENSTGNYNCSPEALGKLETWALSGSFTYFDNQLSTEDREYILKADISNTGLDNRVQRLSIVTQEA